MTNFIAFLGLFSAFIALYALHKLPSDLDKMKASLAFGLTYLGFALLIYLFGISFAVLDFANV